MRMIKKPDYSIFLKLILIEVQRFMVEFGPMTLYLGLTQSIKGY